MFEVKVIETKSGEVVKVIDDIRTVEKAIKVEKGLLINMNHDCYHTEIDGC
jgi:hypothetical protein